MSEGVCGDAEGRLVPDGVLRRRCQSKGPHLEHHTCPSQSVPYKYESVDEEAIKTAGIDAPH